MSKKNREELQAEKQRLDNQVVLSTFVVLLLTVVLAPVSRMINNTASIGVVRGCFQILMWAGVVCVAVFTVLAVVKKNRRLFGYTAIGGAVGLGSFFILKLGTGAGLRVYLSGFALVYYGMIAYLILDYVYYFLYTTRRWQKKGARIFFYILSGIFLAAYLITVYFALLPTFGIRIVK